MRIQKFKSVDEYISKADAPAKVLLRQLRSVIKKTAPQAKERISYDMPFYEYKSPGYKGRLVYFAAFKNHASIFIVPRRVPPALAQQLKRYKKSKSALHFALGKKPPITLIQKVVKLRMKEIDKDLA